MRHLTHALPEPARPRTPPPRRWGPILPPRAPRLWLPRWRLPPVAMGLPVFKDGKPLFKGGLPAFADDPCACCDDDDGSEDCVTPGTRTFTIEAKVIAAAEGTFTNFLGQLSYNYYSHEIYGQHDSNAVVWPNNTSAGGLACGGCKTGSPLRCTQSQPVATFPAYTTVLINGSFSTSAGDTNTYRFWRAQVQGCDYPIGHANCQFNVCAPGECCDMPEGPAPTSQTITVTNTGTGTIKVNGTNLAPGFSRIFSGIDYAGYSTGSYEAYGGGTTVTVVSACA